MPDVDSEAEKSSPLLEVGISYEKNGTSRVEISVSGTARLEISVTDPKDPNSHKCGSDNPLIHGIAESPTKAENIPLEIPITGYFPVFHIDGLMHT